MTFDEWIKTTTFKATFSPFIVNQIRESWNTAINEAIKVVPKVPHWPGKTLSSHIEDICIALKSLKGDLKR